jgi:hypothetical protein
MNDADWVPLAEYAAVYEAELAAGRLESVGIPSRINPHRRHSALGHLSPLNYERRHDSAA